MTKRETGKAYYSGGVFRDWFSGAELSRYVGRVWADGTWFETGFTPEGERFWNVVPNQERCPRCGHTL